DFRHFTLWISHYTLLSHKGNRMLKYAVLCILVAVVCGSLISDDATDKNKLDKVMDDFYKWKLKTYPTFATGQGVHDYDDKLTSYNYTVFDGRREACMGFLQRAKAINRTRSDLNPQDLVNLHVLIQDLTSYTEGIRWKNYGNLNPITFLEGIHRSPGGWVNAMFRNTTNLKLTFDNYFKRLQAVPVMIDEHIECMRLSIKLNTTNSFYSMAAVPEQMEGIFVNVTQTRYWWPMNDTLDNTTVFNVTEKEQLRSRATEQIQEILSKWKDLKTFIEGEYMNNTRPEIGVTSFKDGVEYYKACLNWHLTYESTAEEVHQIGLDEVKRIQGDMQKVMTNVGWTGDLQGFFAHLKNRSEFYNHTEEDLLKGYQDIIDKLINPKLHLVIKNETIPTEPCVVKRMPYNGPSGSYGGGTFWANTRKPTTRPTYTMIDLALHEANPGHHLQNTVAAQLSIPNFRKDYGGAEGDTTPFLSTSHFIQHTRRPNYTMIALALHEANPGHHLQITTNDKLPNPAFRSHLWYQASYAIPFNFPFHTTYIEGWGLYSEYLGEKGELDVYPTQYDLFGRYSSEMLRACRLVVDTGMHALGWSRQRAIDLLANNTAVSYMQIDTEIDRYITWPGQATAYKIGEIAIKKMREDGERILGDAFDKREFHDRILRLGRVPMSLLQEKIDEYIEEERVKLTTTPVVVATTISSSDVRIATIPLLIVAQILQRLLTVSV
ncbi:unnamed protein product, partial [Owenia fusiformis]